MQTNQLSTNANLVLNNINKKTNVDEIVNKTGLSKNSVYSNIGVLLRKEMIQRLEENGEKLYQNLTRKEEPKKTKKAKDENEYWAAIVEAGEPVMYVEFFNRKRLRGMKMISYRKGTWKKLSTARENIEYVRLRFPSAKIIQIAPDGTETVID